MTNILASIIVSLVTNQSDSVLFTNTPAGHIIVKDLKVVEQSIIKFSYQGRTYSLPFHNETVKAKKATPPMPPLPPGLKLSTNVSRSLTPASVPLTGPPPPMSVMVTTNINFLGCDLLEPGCVMFFSQHIKDELPAGAELTIYMKDQVKPPGGYQLAYFGAASYARTVEFRWYQEMFKFPAARFFYDMKVIPIVPASRTSVPIDRVNRELKYADAWSTPKPK